MTLCFARLQYQEGKFVFQFYVLIHSRVITLSDTGLGHDRVTLSVLKLEKTLCSIVHIQDYSILHNM